jgi:hypothetical protein
MKTSTWLTLVSTGAILALAITRSPSFLNLQVVGWVLIGTGGIGAIMAEGGRGAARRGGAGQDEEAEDAVIVQPSQERARYSRILMPGGVFTSRRSAVRPAGDLQRETVKR